MSVSKNYYDELGNFKPKKNGAVLDKTLSQPQNYLEISVKPETILKIVLLIIFCLVLLSTVGQLYSYLVPGEKLTRTIKLFFLDKENNMGAGHF